MAKKSTEEKFEILKKRVVSAARMLKDTKAELTQTESNKPKLVRLAEDAYDTLIGKSDIEISFGDEKEDKE